MGLLLRECRTMLCGHRCDKLGESSEGDGKHFQRKPVFQLRLQGGKGG